MIDSIAILDFGSQYANDRAARARGAHYCELFPWDAPRKSSIYQAKRLHSFRWAEVVYEPNAPYIQKYILDSGLPILGICYGMQALTHALAGK